MKLILALSFLLSSFAFGQIKPEIRSLLQEIREELRNTNDRRVLNRTKKQLENTLAVLQGGSSDPGQGPGGLGRLSCVARDNDGRDPWMLGMKDPQTLRTTKLSGSVLGNLNQCNVAKETGVVLRNSVFLCVSRDNDGREPYVIAHYRGNKLIKKINNLGSFNNCTTSLQSAARSWSAIAFCATRDNDGRAPWVEMSVVGESGQTNRAGSYQSLDQCLSSNKSTDSGLQALVNAAQ